MHIFVYLREQKIPPSNPLGTPFAPPALPGTYQSRDDVGKYLNLCIYYLAGINLLTFLVYGIDSWKARHTK